MKYAGKNFQARRQRKMANNKDITKIAEQQRHLSLLKKVNAKTALSKNELAELKVLERKYKVKEPVEKPEFTVKQQRFIDAYDGDIKKAAVKAEITYQYARRCATKSNIMAAIKSRQDTEVRPNTIMNRQQRQEFWTKVAESEDEAMRDRLRASELLGKSNADFVEVHLDVKKSVLSPEDAQAIIDENEKRF